MKGINFAAAWAAKSSPNPWTCRTCLQKGRKAGTAKQLIQEARYSTRPNWNQQRPRRRGVYIAAAGGTALGVTGLAFTDDVRHAYEAVGRTGRVVSTLFLCINE